MRTRIVFAMVCFVVTAASGQNQREIDSLVNVLKSASQEDSVQIYHHLAIQWFTFDRNKSLLYSKLECKQATEFGDSVMILKSLRLRGQIFRYWKEYDSAEFILRPLLSMAKRLKRDDELLYLYMSLGALNLHIGRYDHCIKFYSEAFKLPRIEDKNEQDIKRTILFNTGLLYYKVHDADRALEFYFNTLALLREAGDPTKEVPQLLINISLCYIANRDFEKGEYYLKQAVEECGDQCSYHLRMQVLFNYGMLFRGQKMLDKAEEFFLKSYSMVSGGDDFRFQLDHIEQLADIYITKGRFNKAKRLLVRADSILSFTRLNSEAARIYWQDIRLCKATRNMGQLATYQEKYLQTRDSVFNTTLRVNLVRAEVEHQQREASSELKRREELIVLKDSLIDWQRGVIALSLATAISVILLLILSVRRSRSRKNANLLLEEKVKERTANYSSALSALMLEFRSHRELANKLRSDIGNKMSAIGVLCSLGCDDSENRTVYFHDIKKLSQKVLQQMECKAKETEEELLG